MNSETNNVVLMDLETQSAIDLRKVGSQAYLRDPSTRLMSVVFLISDLCIVWIPPGRMNTTGLMKTKEILTTTLRTVNPDLRLVFSETEEVPAAVRFEIKRGCLFVAHNADNFDRLAWERFAPPDLQPDWYDTIHSCRASGLPAGLDKASKALGGEGKDERGSRAMKLLTVAKVKSGHCVYPIGTPEIWIQLLRYNIIDVLELRRIFEATGMPEPELLAVHRKINHRGIPVDLPLARKLRDLWTELGDTARDEVAELTGGALKDRDLDSPQKVKNWLAKKGFPVQSLSRAHIEQMLNDPEGFFGDEEDNPDAALVEMVLRARQNAVRTAPGKLDRILGSAGADSRVRNWAVYYGAHTGRFSAREIQPHNFPRGVADLDIGWLLDHWHRGELTVAAVSDAAERAGCSAADVLASLMRPVIRAPRGRVLIPCDYASVEARCVAWLSRDDRMLDAFKSRDIYCEMASIIFGRPITKKDKDERQLGKIIVLGCGYGMGPPKFGITAKLGGADLEKLCITAEQCVKSYRGTYPSVPLTWRAYDRAFRLAIDGTESTAGRCVFRKVGDDVRIVLPSGRELVYRNARVEPITPVWGGPPRPAPVYTTSHGYRRNLYGGILMENISQATCRDLLCTAMIQIENYGPDVVMHVHDEIVCEGPADAAEGMLELMLETISTPPEWAAGFPLACEGFTTEHYIKSPLPGFLAGEAKLGEIKKLETVKAKDATESKPRAGFSSVVFGPLRFDPAAVLPDSPEDWPYWSPDEPKTEDEEQALLAGIGSTEDVYRVAGRYGINAAELRRLADAEHKAEDEYIAARRRLYRHLRETIGLAPTHPLFESDNADPRFAAAGVHWDLIIAHLLTSNNDYAEAFPFRESGNADETATEEGATTWIWRFYQEGEPRRRTQRERLEQTLRGLLERRREIKTEVIPF